MLAIGVQPCRGDVGSEGGVGGVAFGQVGVRQRNAVVERVVDEESDLARRERVVGVGVVVTGLADGAVDRLWVAAVAMDDGFEQAQEGDHASGVGFVGGYGGELDHAHGVAVLAVLDVRLAEAGQGL